MASDWQVETLRITVFPSDINAVSMSKLWDSVIGQDPDAIHFQKDVIDAREVRLGNGRMVLAKQTDRIDWHYLSIQDNKDSVQLPIIGKLDEELNTFTDVANACLDSSYLLSMNRMAFGAVLLHPVITVEDGNLFLEGKLAKMNLEGVRDFNYQVNRRRKSQIDPEIEINRLSKWNVYSGQLVTVTIDPIRGQQVSTTTGLSIASKLELDINTFPERTGPLPTHELSAIFGELIDLGLEISERGDIS